MRRAGGGSIIMSSVAGLCGSAGSAGYCANEGGVRLFAKAVAMECAAAGDGIRVNTVHPGIIDTPIWTKSPTSSGSNALIDPNEVAKPVYRSAGLGKHRICERCALSRLRRLQLHDGSGAGDRRRHDRRRKTSVELNWMAGEKALPASVRSATLAESSI